MATGTLVNPAAATQKSLLQGIAPETGADQAAIGGLQEQYNLVAPETAQNQAYANALAGIQSSQYGVQQQTTGLQTLEGQQQGAQNQAQQGVEEKNFGLSQAAIGIQGGELANQQASLNLNYGNALRGQQDAGAAQGTTYTHGQGAAVKTLGEQQTLATGALNLQGQLLNNQGQQQENTQQGEESGYAFNQQQLANAQANIGLIAKSNGLSNQQALTMLNYQSQQAGLQGQAQSAQLLSQIGTTALSDEQTIGTALGLQSFAQGAGK